MASEVRLDADPAETFVRIRLRIVGNGIAVAEIFANGFESFHLLLPGFCEVTLAARVRRDAFENRARYRVIRHLAGGDDVNRNAFIFCDRPHVIGSHHAGVIGTV